MVNPLFDIADIAISNDLYIICYVPEKYLDKIYYNQPLNITTSIGFQTGQVNYIALKQVYTPKDMQTSSDSKHKAVKIKVAIKDDSGILKSGMTANVDVPLN